MAAADHLAALGSRTSSAMAGSNRDALDGTYGFGSPDRAEDRSRVAPWPEGGEVVAEVLPAVNAGLPAPAVDLPGPLRGSGGRRREG